MHVTDIVRVEWSADYCRLIIRGFDNAVMAIMWLGFFHINTNTRIIEPSDYRSIHYRSAGDSSLREQSIAIHLDCIIIIIIINVIYMAQIRRMQQMRQNR